VVEFLNFIMWASVPSSLKLLKVFELEIVSVPVPEPVAVWVRMLKKFEVAVESPRPEPVAVRSIADWS
jgi:hypothetical protein